MLGVLAAPYATTRYGFLVYPLGIYALVRSVGSATTWWMERLTPRLRRWAPGVAAASSCALFASAEDFNPLHIARVASPEVEFRLGPFERFEATWYSRSDYASPAAYLDRVPGREGTRIIVLGNPPISHYLRADHAVYYHRADPRFRRVSREGGQIDLWSGRRLLSTVEEVRAYTARADRVLVVRSTLAAEEWLRLSDVWPDRLQGTRQELTSGNGRLEVIAVQLAPAADPEPS